MLRIPQRINAEEFLFVSKITNMTVVKMKIL